MILKTTIAATLVFVYATCSGSLSYIDTNGEPVLAAPAPSLVSPVEKLSEALAASNIDGIKQALADMSPEDFRNADVAVRALSDAAEQNDLETVKILAAAMAPLVEIFQDDIINLAVESPSPDVAIAMLETVKNDTLLYLTYAARIAAGITDAGGLGYSKYIKAVRPNIATNIRRIGQIIDSMISLNMTTLVANSLMMLMSTHQSLKISAKVSYPETPMSDATFSNYHNNLIHIISNIMTRLSNEKRRSDIRQILPVFHRFRTVFAPAAVRGIVAAARNADTKTIEIFAQFYEGRHELIIHDVMSNFINSVASQDKESIIAFLNNRLSVREEAGSAVNRGMVLATRNTGFVALRVLVNHAGQNADDYINGFAASLVVSAGKRKTRFQLDGVTLRPQSKFRYLLNAARRSEYGPEFITSVMNKAVVRATMEMNAKALKTLLFASREPNTPIDINNGIRDSLEIARGTPRNDIIRLLEEDMASRVAS